jgi:hypothetical protein
MIEDLIVPFAAFYASIVSIAYRRIGLFPALIWPFIIVCMGIIVFLSMVFSFQHPEE